MASIPDAGSPVPENSGTATPAQHGGRLRSRLLRKKVLAPIVLAVIGGLLFLAALALYPSEGELATPSFATLELRSSFSIENIDYVVSQTSSSMAAITVIVDLPGGAPHPPASAPALELYLYPPSGVSFRTCPIGSCYWNGEQYYWVDTLNFDSEGIDDTWFATAIFSVRAHSLGYAFNDINASAAIPQIIYAGPGSLTLQTQYDNATSASSYDWSALPTEFVNNTTADWDEPVTSGVGPGRVAVGINHSNEEKDSNKTFFAGALIGLAGGALLSAVQEALHANDR